MLIPDMPAAPPQEPPVVMIAQTNQTQGSTKNAERLLGVCSVIANEPENYPNSTTISIIFSALDYLQEYEHRNDFTDGDYDAAKVTILIQPNNGALVEDGTLKGRYIYSPKAGYYGKDSVEALVEIKGMKVKVSYFIHVTEYREPNPYDNNCNEAPTNPWKISQDNNGNPVLTLLSQPASTAPDTLTSSSLTTKGARLEFPMETGT